MQQEMDARKQQVSRAMGISMVEGRKPSSKAVKLAEQYIDGKISAEQMKNLYIKSLK